MGKKRSLLQKKIAKKSFEEVDYYFMAILGKLRSMRDDQISTSWEEWLDHESLAFALLDKEIKGGLWGGLKKNAFSHGAQSFTSLKADLFQDINRFCI